MSRYFINKDIKQPNLMAVLYHKQWIAKIKKSLGKNCVFLQHVRKDKLSLVDRLHKNEPNDVVLPKILSKESEHFLECRFKAVGGIKRITFQIEGTPSDVSNENYVNLQTQLIDYARTQKFI